MIRFPQADMCVRCPAALIAAALLCRAAEPKLTSIHPFTGQRATTFTVTLRGTALENATAVYGPLKAQILPNLQLRIEAPDKPGRYDLRIVTASGVSNALPIHIIDYAVTPEPPGSHEAPETAVAVPSTPAVYTGLLEKRGESDYYAFDAQAGQTLTFEIISGLPSLGAPGGNARGFDPAISIHEASGSWFDTHRLNRIAVNDEPLWNLGQPTDAYLVHTFPKAGRYYLRIEAFSGQGGPDYGYQLKILPGTVTQDRAPSREAWQERTFPRQLAANRLTELAQRGAKPPDNTAIETYRTSAQPIDFKLPANLEGAIGQPGETHRARFSIDKPADIAIEVETLDVAPPLFNPVVRVLGPRGEETATTFFAGRGACTGALNKSLQSKLILPLRDTGNYTLEIRDITSDHAEPGFRYRVQVRPQVPHVGAINVDADAINLARGDAKTVRVNFDREEDYRGAVAVVAEQLPPGVQAMAGADFEPDKDPPRYPGKRERYTPRSERSVLVFTAAPDAPLTNTPQLIRVQVRPVFGGKPGPIIATKEIPIMVVAKP